MCAALRFTNVRRHSPSDFVEWYCRRKDEEKIFILHNQQHTLLFTSSSIFKASVYMVPVPAYFCYVRNSRAEGETVTSSFFICPCSNQPGKYGVVGGFSHPTPFYGQILWRRNRYLWVLSYCSSICSYSSFIVSKITFVNLLAEFVGNIYCFYCFFASRCYFHHDFIKSTGSHPFLGLSSAKLESASSKPLSSASVEMRAIIRHLARILFERFVWRLS